MKQFALVMLGLVFVLPGVAQETKPKGLELYDGKDLLKLDEHARAGFQKVVQALTGDKLEKQLERSSYEPWWVKPFAGGKAAWVLLEAYPGYDVPDMSGVQIHLFDNKWQRLRKQSFPTGYRFFLNEVTLVKENPLKRDLLAAKVTSSGPFIVRGEDKHPVFEQGDYQLQYYALLGDHFVMVRLEDNKKKLAQNHYRWSSPPKGPAVPKRTRDEWIRSLRSEDPVEQLATLVWLSGAHLPSTEKRQEKVNQESVEDSKLFEAVRDATETKKALRELANSKNSWVQEYSKLTLQVINE
jgi:hypothetical protein